MSPQTSGKTQKLWRWWGICKVCLIFMAPPPLLEKKGAYCFAPVRWSVSWSICRCRPSYVCSISFDPFARKLPSLIQWMPLRSWWPKLIFRYVVKGQGQTAGLWKKCCPLIIYWTLCWIVANLIQWMPLESTWLHTQRSRPICWSLKKCCFLNISWPLCWKFAKLGTVNVRE